MESVATPANQPDGSDNLLVLQDAQFREHFDRHPFKITHHLAGRPLRQLPRLGDSIKALTLVKRRLRRWMRPQL